MRRLIAFAALLPACLGLIGAAPEPAKPIQLQNYTGRWYEVAHLHNMFQEDCTGAEVNYTPTPDGGFRVVDTCLRTGKPPKVYHPSMKVLDPGTNAKFRLTFFPFIWKDYWILDYAPDNSWVVLGEPTGRYLWLFSRTPDLQSHKGALVSRAKSLGYDTGKLIYDRAS
jgi:apolipoprotein D and lipocalin family protein